MAELDDLEKGVGTVLDRAPEYQLLSSYFDGDHRLAFSTEQWTTEFGKLFKAFAVNYCPRVVGAMADRLTLTGFDSPSTTVKAAVERVWKDNKLERRQGDVHKKMARDGDAYVIVWPHPVTGRPWFYVNDADKMALIIDPETGDKRFAVKLWEDEEKHGRVTMYYSDRIVRYRTKAKLRGGFPRKRVSYEPYVPPPAIDPETGEPLEEEGDYEIENPYGKVPVFQFANDGEEGERSRSELSDAVPVQDALNTSVANLLIGLEFHSLPQRWATGLEKQINPETLEEEEQIEAGADRIMAVASTETRFGQFDAADLEALLHVTEGFESKLARVTATPVHLLMLSGDFPSGEALRAAEGPLVSKVEDRQGAVSTPWEDAMRFALEILDREDNEDPIEAEPSDDPEEVSEVDLNALWKNPTSWSELDKANAVEVKRRNGISEEQGLREMGYTEAEIEQMAEEKRAAKEAAAAEFDAGLNTGFDPAATPPMPGIPADVIENDLTGQ